MTRMSYLCRECGAEAIVGDGPDDAAYCAEHPEAIIDSVQQGRPFVPPFQLGIIAAETEAEWPGEYRVVLGTSYPGCAPGIVWTLRVRASDGARV